MLIVVQMHRVVDNFVDRLVEKSHLSTMRVVFVTPCPQASTNFSQLCAQPSVLSSLGKVALSTDVVLLLLLLARKVLVEIDVDRLS